MNQIKTVCVEDNLENGLEVSSSHREQLVVPGAVLRDMIKDDSNKLQPIFIKFSSLGSLHQVQDLSPLLGNPKVLLLENVFEHLLDPTINWNEITFEFDDDILRMPTLPQTLSVLHVDCTKHTLSNPLRLPLNSWKLNLPHLSEFSLVSEEGSTSIPLDMYHCSKLKSFRVKFLDCYEFWLPNLQVGNGIESIEIEVSNDAENQWYTQSMFSKMVEIRIGQLPCFSLKSLKIVYPKGTQDEAISLDFTRFAKLEKLSILENNRHSSNHHHMLRETRLSPQILRLPPNLKSLETTKGLHLQE